MALSRPGRRPSSRREVWCGCLRRVEAEGQGVGGEAVASTTPAARPLTVSTRKPGTADPGASGRGRRRWCRRSRAGALCGPSPVSRTIARRLGAGRPNVLGGGLDLRCELVDEGQVGWLCIALDPMRPSAWRAPRKPGQAQGGTRHPGPSMRGGATSPTRPDLHLFAWRTSRRSMKTAESHWRSPWSNMRGRAGGAGLDRRRGAQLSGRTVICRVPARPPGTSWRRPRR